MRSEQVSESRVETGGPVHELLARRWSPRAFSTRPVEKAKLTQLFQAARWAPSSYNAQPWFFVVTTRDGDDGHDRLLRTLMDVNREWAQHAPVLVLAVAKETYSHNGAANRHAAYDLGQAVAHLTVEATGLGLYLHQMGGFDPALARKLFAIPAGFQPLTVIALGYLEGVTEPANARMRKPLEDFVFSGSWGQPAPWVATSRS